MGSSGFSHECQLEHPLKMGEDSKQGVVAVDIFLDRMTARLTCIWWRDRHPLTDASG